ncbi:MAG: NHLP bacteriocin export ABC transporter permease/ATPase subunit, partial [Selenomonadaceae bacterium]|nr:NHLP bacteriocin export ABC transporter permease/ATPase subunit [Selenomonadaceae bacterium]
AAEDSVFEKISPAQIDADEMRRVMENWFENLISLQWLRLLADKGDDALKLWIDKTVFAECGNDKTKILDAFTHHEQIFSMLVGVRFQSNEKQLGDRINIRKRQKRRLVEDSISTLLGEDKIFYEEDDKDRRSQKSEEATFIVKIVATAMKMPLVDVSINPDIAKKLDAVGVIRRMMQKQNMQMRFVTLTKGWYKKDSGVLIGYYGENKTLAAMIPTAPDKYKIVTKDFPDGIPIDEDSAQKIDKAAFVCYAGFPARKLKVMDLVKFMFRQSWKDDYRTIIIVSLFAGIVPLVTPIITETIFRDILPILDRKGLVTVTQVMMVTSFTMAAMSIIRSVALIRIATHLDMAVEAALWSRLLSLPEKFFRKFQSGELAHRMTGMESVKSFIDGHFIAAVFDTIFSFWSLFLMCYYSLKLTAAAIFIWLIWCLITAFIYRRVLGFQRGLINAGNKESGLIQQIFAGLAKFRVHGAEEQAYNLWSKVFGETWQWNLKLRWQGNYNLIISSIQPFILTMLLYYVAIYEAQPVTEGGKIISEGMGYAQFLAFSAAYSSFNATLNSLIPLVGQFFTVQPHIENLRPILDEEPEITDDKIDADVLTGKMKISELTFSYGEKLPDVLKDISFEVSAGENLAIVGKSGCGKSTLVRLLLGFEKPKKGAIYFDGQDLASLSLPSVRSQMGVVLQNGQLMQGDIFTNIIGTANLTQDDAWAAAEAAGIADDIRKMPMGMQTVIGEGSSNISGGQRQRILIARALAAKPAILIFDEATSALDNKSQAIVTKSIEKLHVTRIVIAHRLSTIRKCDRIIVMDGGKIAESGTFDELVKAGGLFSTLVKRQTV